MKDQMKCTRDHQEKFPFSTYDEELLKTAKTCLQILRDRCDAAQAVMESIKDPSLIPWAEQNRDRLCSTYLDGALALRTLSLTTWDLGHTSGASQFHTEMTHFMDEVRAYVAQHRWTGMKKGKTK